jgi:hypothetical protein
MSKLRLLLPLAAIIGLAPIFTASAEPVRSCFQQDSLKEFFLASSLAAKVAPKCGAYCDMAGGGTSPTAPAAGDTCATANTDLSQQLHAYASSYCGNLACHVTIVTTVACHPLSTGGYEVSGYATFGCPDSTC